MTMTTVTNLWFNTLSFFARPKWIGPVLVVILVLPITALTVPLVFIGLVNEVVKEARE